MVPKVIAPIMAMESGRCSSEPISEVNSSGTMAKIVVSVVMTIARKRFLPPVWIASVSGIPVFLSSLMVSSFKIESFITIPLEMTIPIADIRFSVSPHSHRQSKAKAISIGISAKTIRGCKKLSNWAHKIKYISKTDMHSITISSPIIRWFEKKLPEKSTSHFPDRATTSRMPAISPGALSTS